MLVSWLTGPAGRSARKAMPVAEGWRGIAQRTVAMLGLLPARLPNRSAYGRPQTFSTQPSRRRGRIALLQGCAQSVLGPQINEAAIRLLVRQGIDVVLAADEACCGSLVHHMGREHQALAQARHNIDVWTREIEGGLDAIVITASGCGTTIKDYGYMLRNDPGYAEKAARVSALARDISEYLVGLDLGPPAAQSDLTVAYQSACSLQHGQKITRQPKDLLAIAGFRVRDIAEAHLCCGSAGTYNIMQPDIARALRDRKVASIERTGADVIATGNIGCMTHIAGGTGIPIVHTVELLDWAYGGPMPDALKGVRRDVNDSQRIAVAI
jgi:glycolate oxidase iron-sulfur subunit